MKKKKIIVTGASRGIGREVALQLVADGHEVIALARNQERLDELVQQAGASCIGIPYDLVKEEAGALEANLATWDRLDVLINNAGRLENKSFEALTDSDWLAIYEVNVFGVVRLIRKCLPLLKQSSMAHILNISSMGGIMGSSKFPGLSAYSSSKGALSILTECLAEEWKNESIRVNSLALGAVQTEMLEEAFPGFKAPLSSTEMAEFVSYFALQGHLFFNGKVLPVSLSTP